MVDLAAAAVIQPFHFLERDQLLRAAAAAQLRAQAQGDRRVDQMLLALLLEQPYTQAAAAAVLMGQLLRLRATEAGCKLAAVVVGVV
jgi:hypothetical protein